MFCTLSKSVKYHEIYHVIDVSVYAPSLKAFSTLRPQQSTLGVGGLEYYLRVWQGKNMNSVWKMEKTAAAAATTTRTTTRTGRKTKRQQPRILPFTHPPSHSLGGVGVPHFVVNQPLSLQNGSGTESPSYKMVCL